VLIIGGGIAGMSAAIALREAGLTVRLIESDPEWKVYGAGITITGPTLRVMRSLGILDRVMAEGYTADGLLACDQEGNIVAEIGTDAGAADEVPGAGGILRPVLHRILSDRLKTLEPEILLGRRIRSIEGDGPHRVVLDDGSAGSYDLVVGADGIFSQTRQLLFPDAPQPRYVGQVCWRLMTQRHAAISRRTYFLGGPSKIGMNPVSSSEMYMFLLEPSAKFVRCAAGLEPVHLAKLMEPYGGVVSELRAMLDANSNIIARPLETVFLPSPWYRNSCVLIGDAAHATTPQLASGAGMAMEDGVVLAECIADADNLALALQHFMSRRFERCRLVVDKSLALGQLERKGATPLEQVRVVEDALRELNQAY
jgi:2-polyprenyl-6-methoxyphenol hydroxylase-like FAD-dependent oxidoreductase